MSTYLSTLLAIVFLAPCAVSQAQFTYVINCDNATITITGNDGYLEWPVVIPSTIAGYPVTSIGPSAFSDAGLTSVTIPNSVTNIGSFAFWSCTSMSSVTIGDSVTDIGDNAFGGCYVLASVTLPNSVTSIGVGAFDRCLDLTNVTIPSSVTSIGDAAFAYCSSLTNILVNAANASYLGTNGILFDKNMVTLIQCPSGMPGDYVIPDGVTTIGNNAFDHCSSLTSVTIPNSVTNIGQGAFYSCSGLASLTIPNGVCSIGDETFAWCSGLTNVTIPNSVTNIGDEAFNYCYALVRVTIPGSVVGIGDSAFAVCGLTSVTIPSSVTSIGDAAFGYCPSLTNILVNAANPSYLGMNGILLDKNMVTLIQFPAGVTGGYVIPNSVTSIGAEAFDACFGLTSVTIPNSVTNIGESAFDRCTSLANVTIPNSVTSIGTEAFVFCLNLKGIDFQGNAPAVGGDVLQGDPFSGAVVYYLPGASGWSSTFAGRPTALWTLPYPQVLNNAPGFGVQNKHFGFTISWATNRSIIVQAATNLTNPVWTPVATNPLVNGTNFFSDPNWTNYPGRFYRILSP